MSSNRMLIDATHPEETRVVVQRNNRVDEFDFESASRKPLRGNIYLAKVTRVEPSLQAAFVDFGGNRHGFLAFSEIHPDYYQIPVADREALIAEEARFAEEEEASEERSAGRGRRGRRRRPQQRRHNGSESISEDARTDGDAQDGNASQETEDQTGPFSSDEAPDDSAGNDTLHAEKTGSDDEDADQASVETRDAEASEPGEEEVQIEQIGGSDGGEDDRENRRRFQMRRRYKIQEVIKRRQILLVQVVKEERGNKGAALTTYLSLAGRYSVLMPNTSRGGGISRKITNSADRKRLKDLQTEMGLPEGMGVILRTAGANQPTEEIRHDFDYLLRVWEQVRETTLKSVAPTLVHEEGSLIKRSLRDLFGKEIDEVVVAGEDGYAEARDFMKMLMPSQLKAVKLYKEGQSLFARYGVETQLDAMFSNTVTLRSGGYIVINQTEALVAIDVNSGRATREHNIEDTALKTNLEAADEVARQLRLRDLAGLIVIDFIDMEEFRNNRHVEKRLKDALRNDRARIQLGRISPFGLMEMSRQRMRTGVVESSTVQCPTCAGSGVIRSSSSIALTVLRAVEEALIKNAQYHLTVKTRLEAALYILNQKRATLQSLESRFGVQIAVQVEHNLPQASHFVLERGEYAPDAGVRVATQVIEEDAEVTDPQADDESSVAPSSGTETGRRRRRRGRRGRERDSFTPEDGDQNLSETNDVEAIESAEGAESDSDSDDPSSTSSPEDTERRRRRRGRRGGRRFKGNNGAPRDASADAIGAEADSGAVVHMTGEADDSAPAAAALDVMPAEPDVISIDEPAKTVAKAPAKRGRGKKTEDADAPAAETADAPKPKRGRPKKEVAAAVDDSSHSVSQASPPASPVAPPAPEPEPEPEVEQEDVSRPKRMGWWSRKK